MDRPYSISYPEPSGDTELTTFYSFKGGVGRSQSLYNVGVRLASLRRKVMMVDVDLEAPGLSIGALGEQVRDTKDGFAEIASDLLFDLDAALDEDPEFFAGIVEDYQVRLNDALHVIDLPMEPQNTELAERLREEMGIDNLPTGSLSLLATGRLDPDYPQRMVSVPIDPAFHQQLTDEQKDRLPDLFAAAGLTSPGSLPSNLGLLFTAVLRFLLRNANDPSTGEAFQHVLIDSRSGLADVGGLCLRGLPDTRVVLSGLNTQNLEGTRMVLNTLQPDERTEDRLTVVFSPVPEGETELVDRRVEAAKKKLYLGEDEDRDRLPEEQIRLLHYHPRIALEEDPFTETFHRRTRIFGEYESLTDRLLALTGSDANSLFSRALSRFSDSYGEGNHGYDQLARDLLPVAFLGEERVESIVDGICSQLAQVEEKAEEALPLFDLWVALSPEDVRVLGMTANYYGDTARSVGEYTEEAEQLFQRCFALKETITKDNPEEDRALSNWGMYLGHLAQLVQGDDPDRAASLYREAFDKFSRATDLDPNRYEAWTNWGVFLVLNGQFLADQGEEAEAQDKFSEAIVKLRQSIEHGGGPDAKVWLVVALAERHAEGDVEKAEDRLQSLLERKPTYVTEFDDEEAKAVRSIPELRAILDTYREKIDEEDLEDANLSDDPGLADTEDVEG